MIAETLGWMIPTVIAAFLTFASSTVIRTRVRRGRELDRDRSVQHGITMDRTYHRMAADSARYERDKAAAKVRATHVEMQRFADKYLIDTVALQSRRAGRGTDADRHEAQALLALAGKADIPVEITALALRRSGLPPAILGGDKPPATMPGSDVPYPTYEAPTRPYAEPAKERWTADDLRDMRRRGMSWYHMGRVTDLGSAQTMFNLYGAMTRDIDSMIVGLDVKYEDAPPEGWAPGYNCEPNQYAAWLKRRGGFEEPAERSATEYEEPVSAAAERAYMDDLGRWAIESFETAAREYRAAENHAAVTHGPIGAGLEAVRAVGDELERMADGDPAPEAPRRKYDLILGEPDQFYIDRAAEKEAQRKHDHAQHDRAFAEYIREAED